MSQAKARLEETNYRTEERADCFCGDTQADAAVMPKQGTWNYNPGTELFEFGDDFYAVYGTDVAREGRYMTPEAYAGKFIHPDDAWIVRAGINNVLASPKSYISCQIIHRGIRLNGEICFIEVHYTMVRDAQGKVISLRGKNQEVMVSSKIEEAGGVNQDITDHLAMENELKDSRDNLSSAAELAKLGPWKYHLDTGLFEFNDDFYAIYGTSVAREGKFMSRDTYYGEFVHPDDLELVVTAVREREAVLRANHRNNILTDSLQLTHRIIRRDGEERTIIVRATIVLDEDGNFVKRFGVNQDITDYTKLETAHSQLALKTKQLQEMTASYYNEANRLQQLIDLCPLAIMMIDGQGRILAANRALLDIVPADEQVIGCFCDKITDALEPEEEETTIMRALRGEAIKEAVDGKGQRWFCSALPIRDTKTNDITGAIAIYNDITEYERMREEMMKFDRLRLVAQMAAGVAHEIRNPMTVVRGYLQFLAGKTEENIQEHFSMMIEELDRANSIISNFLSLAQNRPPERKRCCINDIIGDIYPLIYGEAVKKGLSIDLSLCKNVACVSGHVKEIKQLILNLCRNAIEAMREKGRLFIATINTGERMQLVIEDTGCGISKEQMKRIFDPFYTTKDFGTGLGLAVSLNIAERHNATIVVESKRNRGTKFTVAFPHHR